MTPNINSNHPSHNVNSSKRRGQGDTFEKGQLYLYRKEWKAANPKAAIVLLHGQGEHSGRYEYTVESFNAHGYDVYSGDLPGHGRSGGARGHIDRFDDYIALAESWIEDAQRQSPELPVFLLGHSVGGLIAARCIQTRELPLAGAILSSPAFQLRFPIPPWKEAIGRRLDRLLPRLRMPSGLKQQRVTRDEEKQRATTADPLMVYVASVRFYNELLRAQAAALKDAARIQLPLLLLHGGADEVIEPAQSIEFGKRVSSQDKKVRLLPNLHHEILNEPEQDDVLRDMVHWLNERVSNDNIRDSKETSEG